MINRQLIIMEASKKAQEIIDKNAFTTSDKLSMVPINPIHTFANMYNGFVTGKDAGHPIAGLLLGREGAVGAMSKHDKNVELSDVYTQKNIKSRALRGGIAGAFSGALTGAAAAGPVGALIGATGGAVTGSAIDAGAMPAVRYGLGKLFGSSTSKKPSNTR